MLVRFPGAVPAGRIANQVRTIDLLPTVLDAAGLEVPEGLEGHSLLPLISGRESGDRPAFEIDTHPH